MAIDNIKVEVAYAVPEKQIIRSVTVIANTLIADAISQSGILQDFPEIDLEKVKVGVFGKIASLKAKLSDGDRIEIYRPLIADPKEVRRKRAAEGKKMKKGGG